MIKVLRRNCDCLGLTLVLEKSTTLKFVKEKRREAEGVEVKILRRIGSSDHFK